MSAPANPPVNRCLPDKEMDLIDHALGRPVDPMRPSYRNYFAAHASIAARFDTSPFWERGGGAGPLVGYAVTDCGRQALADYLSTLPHPVRLYAVEFCGGVDFIPAMTPGEAKYAHWLSLRDLRPDLTFGFFVRSARVRLADAEETS